MSSRCSRKLICLSAIGRSVKRAYRTNLHLLQHDSWPARFQVVGLPRTAQYPKFPIFEFSKKNLNPEMEIYSTRRQFEVRFGEKFESDGNLIAFKIF